MNRGLHWLAMQNEATQLLDKHAHRRTLHSLLIDERMRLTRDIKGSPANVVVEELSADGKITRTSTLLARKHSDASQSVVELKEPGTRGERSCVFFAVSGPRRRI